LLHEVIDALTRFRDQVSLRAVMRQLNVARLNERRDHLRLIK
jgi:hypothetical protein